MDAPELGLHLRRLRTARGLSQEAAAGFARRSLRWYWGLENGDGGSRLTPETAAGLAFGFRVEPTVVFGLVPFPGDLEDDVKRRDFLRVGAVAAASASGLVPTANPLDAEPWERLARVLAQPSSIDPATLDHMEAATLALEALEYDLAPVALIGPVRGHLEELTRLLEQPLPSAARSQLLSLAGETAATAGWLMWDLDRPTDVRAYWQVAATAAADANDRPLGAFVAVSSSFLYREQPAERLQVLLTQERAATSRTRAWVFATQAEAYALLGDERGCMRSLERAEATLARLGDERSDARRPRYDPFDIVRMTGERGASLVKLAGASDRFRSRGLEARTVLERSIAEMQGQPRMVNSMRASLARALAQLGDVDGATHTAHVALDGVSAMGIETTRRTLRKVVKDLAPWENSPAVRDLRERLAS